MNGAWTAKPKYDIRTIPRLQTYAQTLYFISSDARPGQISIPGRVLHWPEDITTDLSTSRPLQNEPRHTMPLHRVAPQYLSMTSTGVVLIVNLYYRKNLHLSVRLEIT